MTHILQFSTSPRFLRSPNTKRMNVLIRH